MKVLSILQPWASLVVTKDPKTGKAYKQIETRSWNTKYRGPLLIHAGIGKQYRKLPTDGPLWMNCPMRLFESMPFGVIIGMVNLVDTFPMETAGKVFQKMSAIGIKDQDQEIAFGDYSTGRTGWILSDPILFQTPIPCKGNLSIWNLPAELEAAVQEQINISTHVDLNCMYCGRIFKGPIPKTYCSGYDCGCGGQPIEPVVCSGACYDSVMKREHFKPTQIASPGEGAVVVEPAEEGTTIQAYGLKTRCWTHHAKYGYGCSECCNGDRCESGCTARYRRSSCPHCKGKGWIPESEVQQPESKPHLPSRGIDGHEKLMDELRKSEIN